MESLDRRRCWHFSIDDEIAASAQRWDPDLEPWKFASGLGHNLLELAIRLRQRGLPVTFGTRIPADAGVVVYFQHAWSPTPELEFALRAASYSTVLIRSDAPLWYAPLLVPDTTVVPNVAGVRYWSDRVNARVVHLPALPQRGMLPRSEARVGVRTLVVKGNPMSVPGYMRDPQFVAALAALSVESLIDIPSDTDGADQSWHDFGNADIVLCARDAAPDDSLLNKPATRLVNAWRAGAIPLVGPEPAYLELVEDGVDGFVVRGPGDVIDIVRRLTEDIDLEARVRAAVRRRAVEYDPEDVLDRWSATLADAWRPRRSAMATFARQTVALGRYDMRIARRTAGRVRHFRRSA